MEHFRSISGNEDNILGVGGVGGGGGGIPEDLRCKRSDGKQWRCSAMSMPDKTVCEKHYIQAKKRAANSALRASLKKAKRNSPFDDIDNDGCYLDTSCSRNDNDVDALFIDTRVAGGGGVGEFSGGIMKNNDQVHMYSSSDMASRRCLSLNSPVMLDDNDEEMNDTEDFDENRNLMYTTPPHESLRNKTQKSFDDASALDEVQSDESMDSSDEEVGLTCHQCQRNDTDRVIWCLKCDKRGYCDSCISKWYPEVPLEEVQKVCPACRGTCSCNVCLHGDNLIKFRIKEIAVTDKLQYFHCLLSAILPVVKHIHHDQCFEMELETKIHGTKPDIPRAKLHADEQMCCNFCRIPIIDYHRHCTNCLYDLCLTCCQDIRQESQVVAKGELAEAQAFESSQNGAILMKQPRLIERRMNVAELSPDWKANTDGSIPCPPKGDGGCGCSSLTLRRIFKMNWVAKLVKNVEEMVDGCKLYNMDSPWPNGLSDGKLCQLSHREDSNDNFLYCPSSQDIKVEGIYHFQKHWARGEPIIVKQVCDCTSSSNWDPMVIWRGIRETADEKTKDENRTVTAIDCLDGSEVDIELGQFIKGYTEGRIHENGWPEMLKLKDWPSPGAAEEFLLYQRPEFLSKLPLIEYIHSKWGLLNVAAKLPYYSLQNDVGPKIYITYGTYEELSRGDSVTNLHTNMRDMVYLLMHTCEVKMKGWQRTKIEKIQRTFKEPDASHSHGDVEVTITEGDLSLDTGPNGHGETNKSCPTLNGNEDEIMDYQLCTSAEATCGTEKREVEPGPSDKGDADIDEKAHVGAVWDVFRRQDVPKLIEYLMVHWKDLRNPTVLSNESDSQVIHPLFDQAVYLNRDHKMKLKEDFGIEPWTFEQHLGEAVFIPSGCPFQARNLQSSVQLTLDFLSPESLGESISLGEEIRCLPTSHKAKRQMLEVGKMSLYASSSAIKDVQKLALDPK
ncbi:hypothetical protein AQUCO_01600289v1 [Aquilegia coerulea]|nr:hypothetical protein AQUCO_01600289v1 [Aquilegia coerulea]